jgi:hypothetical protein
VRLAERLPVALAGYYSLAFGSEEDRFRFTHYPQDRDPMTDRVLLAGGVGNESGQFVEVLW